VCDSFKHAWILWNKVGEVLNSADGAANQWGRTKWSDTAIICVLLEKRLFALSFG